MDSEKISDLKAQIINYSNQCVKCGLCLSGCPTYKVYKNEAKSPRGRLSLMQAL
ncbi:MAG: (Fe-S)-binding protein, partial [Francisellaceae bacterium]|nr:(Fe-S)-binding protein [Francisellaceae bacterium]